MTMEGSGASRLYQLFGGGSGSSGIEIKLATIKALPPTIAVQVDGDSIDTPVEGIIVAEYLTEHKRTINGAEAIFSCDLKVGDSVIVVIANDGQVVYVLDKAVV